MNEYLSRKRAYAFAETFQECVERSGMECWFRITPRELLFRCADDAHRKGSLVVSRRIVDVVGCEPESIARLEADRLIFRSNQKPESQDPALIYSIPQPQTTKDEVAFHREFFGMV